MPGLAQWPSAAPMAGQDPALSMSHPFYDVARHGILQVAGESQLGGPQEPQQYHSTSLAVGPVTWGRCLRAASLQ